MMTVYLCPCLSSGCFEHHHPLLLSSILLPRPAGLHNADWRFHRCCCLRPHLWLLRGTNTLSTFIRYVSHTGIYESRTRKRFQIFFLFSHKSADCKSATKIIKFFKKCRKKIINHPSHILQLFDIEKLILFCEILMLLPIKHLFEAPNSRNVKMPFICSAHKKKIQTGLTCRTEQLWLKFIIIDILSYYDYSS